MASVFGYAGLKTKLGDWVGQRGRGVPAWRRSGKSPPLSDGEQARDDVNRLVEMVVIPRLFAATVEMERQSVSTVRRPAESRPAGRFSEDEIAEFSRLCVNEDTARLLDIVGRDLAAGHSVEAIYVELLAPAARLLGELWESDGVDFVDVTMALWRIQEVLRELTVRVPPPLSSGSGMRSALITPMPGDQHSLGTLMVADVFERSGWQVDALIEPSQSDLMAKCAGQAYDVIALTISCDCSSARLARMVTSLRTVSDNRHVKIMVGGHAINCQPQMAVDCGADGTAVDAPSAVALADRLVPAIRVGLDYLA